MCVQEKVANSLQNLVGYSKFNRDIAKGIYVVISRVVIFKTKDICMTIKRNIRGIVAASMAIEARTRSLKKATTCKNLEPQ